MRIFRSLVKPYQIRCRDAAGLWIDVMQTLTRMAGRGHELLGVHILRFWRTGDVDLTAVRHRQCHRRMEVAHVNVRELFGDDAGRPLVAFAEDAESRRVPTEALDFV